MDSRQLPPQVGNAQVLPRGHDLEGHDLGRCRFDFARDGERQARFPDQRWNGIRQAESAVKTLLGWRIAAFRMAAAHRYLRQMSTLPGRGCNG
jgi:hypothetical protein